MKMLRFFAYTMIAVTVVYGVPFGCGEDIQCSDGYFCDEVTHFCRECLRCRDLGRNEPKIFGTNCIRSGADCGLCFNSFVYYNGNIDAKCVPVEEFKQMLFEKYILPIAIFISLLIVVIFIQTLRNTEVFQITYSSLTSISPRNYNKKELQVSTNGCKI